ncbi:coiled-coil domain-containing protein 9B-like [Rhincodon typus]|uniref:coiled-coil domain-containing protein 9B-like n=1 Tax=Rhincodon typus TaxID=259920 RepID=UPI00202E800B|nr:coiled-coil domain-containing protein 9B-like [Rhincodon typus]
MALAVTAIQGEVYRTYEEYKMMDTAVDVILKTKEEKDVELDKKIEALRKKNEALMKRYQEIEEDKKKAELEGMAVTTRKNRPENLTITITKAPNEKRVVSEKRTFGGASILRGCESDAGQRFSVGRGQRLRKFVVEESKAKIVNKDGGVVVRLTDLYIAEAEY